MMKNSKWAVYGMKPGRGDEVGDIRRVRLHRACTGLLDLVRTVAYTLNGVENFWGVSSRRMT